MNRPSQVTACIRIRIAIICALPLEADAVKAILDEVYEGTQDIYTRHSDDTNIYTLGRIGPHHVVVVQMSGMGTLNGTIASGYLRYTFKEIKIALVVGICGAVPQLPDGRDIFLGDVLISNDGLDREAGLSNLLRWEFNETDNWNDKSELVRDTHRLEAELAVYLRIAQKASADEQYQYPGAEQDQLFPAYYQHRHPASIPCDLCSRYSRIDGPGCLGTIHLSCDLLGCARHLVTHEIRRRSDGASDICTHPRVHYGTIASSDMVMRSGKDRDKFAADHGVIGFEMEGAEVDLYLPSVIIKGVCDYADSHKSKTWQHYAALSAACCVKALLGGFQPSDQNSGEGTAGTKVVLLPARHHQSSCEFVVQIHFANAVIGIVLAVVLLWVYV
ncbi:purine and uridine phosphorylase [Aspergillus homomorphus CBS 101889]|uniref:Purine and uridine phosphorylase n=1 Tax=Aspergillus homomorphus (strain CBS 101889) TaxID=1450537 RepID=A0A395I049_ASPHC|nr:purine and uridine phosphorylase [Aspergillus homomorphus CBS 101889]RAL13430.1 purine and uridine phosphorylase [Aspergillus homomorphus CBS 101889]